jgi:hypothetical protein
MWSDFLSGEAGDAINDLFLDFACFDKYESSLQFENLFKKGPIWEVLELAADGESSMFDTTTPALAPQVQV